MVLKDDYDLPRREAPFRCYLNREYAIADYHRELSSGRDAALQIVSSSHEVADLEYCVVRAGGAR